MARIRKLLIAAFGMWVALHQFGPSAKPMALPKTGPNLIEENENFFVTNQEKLPDSLAL